MMTGFEVLKMVLMPSSARFASLENSGPRWSMIGVSIARRMRSGSGLGPGICRKWRPALRAEFFDIASFSFRQAYLANGIGRDRGPRASSPARLVAMNDE